MSDEQAMKAAAPVETGLVDRDNPPAWTLETPEWREPEPDAAELTCGFDLKAMTLKQLHALGVVALMRRPEREALATGVLAEMNTRVKDETLVDLTDE